MCPCRQAAQMTKCVETLQLPEPRAFLLALLNFRSSPRGFISPPSETIAGRPTRPAPLLPPTGEGRHCTVARNCPVGENRAVAALLPPRSKETKTPSPSLQPAGSGDWKRRLKKQTTKELSSASLERPGRHTPTRALPRSGSRLLDSHLKAAPALNAPARRLLP